MGCCDKRTNKCNNEKKAEYKYTKDKDGNVIDKEKVCDKWGDNYGPKCLKDSDCVEGFNNYNNMHYSFVDSFEVNGDVSAEVDKWFHQENTPIIKDKRRVDIVKEGPVYMYNQLVNEYGSASVLANEKNGIAIWDETKLNDNIHYSLELRDEYVPHCVPAPHHDFLISYIKVHIPSELLYNVLTVSGSIAYDGLKKLLSARCASLEANMATFATAFQVMNNNEKKYPSNIKNRYSSYEENREYVKQEIKRNNKVYAKELQYPYYPGAFPKGCPN